MNSPPVATAQSLGAGVLHAGAAATRFTLRRYPPPATLAPFVDFCWLVRWDLRGQPEHEQAILPHPNVHLAFEATGAACSTWTGRSSRGACRGRARCLASASVRAVFVPSTPGPSAR